MEKLKWMNGVYIRKLDDKQLLQETLPFINEEFKQQGKDLLKAVQLVKNNLSTLNEVNDYIKIFFEMPIYTSRAIEKQINKNVFLKVIKVLIEVLNKTETEIDDVNIKDIVKKVTSESGVKGKDLYMSIRLGITAQVHGPDLVGTLVVLGKEEILKRLKLVLSNFKE
jgi:glutamyl/glutaminyl-tRNA synthetase